MVNLIKCKYTAEHLAEFILPGWPKGKYTPRFRLPCVSPWLWAGLLEQEGHTHPPSYGKHIYIAAGQNRWVSRGNWSFVGWGEHVVFLRRMDEQSDQKGRKTGLTITRDRIYMDPWRNGHITQVSGYSLLTRNKLMEHSGPLRPVSAVTQHNKHFKWSFLKPLYCTCVLALPYLLTLLKLLVIKYISSWNWRPRSTLKQDRGKRRCNFS